MGYTAKQYATALHQAIFESSPQDQEKILDNFVAILKENGDLGIVAAIEQEFYAVEREVLGVKLAEVTSAREISSSEEKKIIQELNEYVGGQVELKKRIDAGLVGGVVIKLEDELLDGSIKKNLQDLKNQLIK